MRTVLVRRGWHAGQVAETAARLLRLLSLLQARPGWTGPELADRLEVTTRTVRRDVDRLRQLGYPVDAAPGVEGGYRLGTGGDLPPLLLDEDEATAVAVALGATTPGRVTGIEHAALSALTKLDRLLPPPLRARVSALRSATVQLAPPTEGVDADVLVTIAQGCAGNERLRLDYCDREGKRSERRIEPYRLVSTGRRWYLLAFDLDRHDWRTFRVDRVEAAARTGHRFAPVPDPPDPASTVGEAMTFAPERSRAVVRFDAPAADIAGRVPPAVGSVASEGDGCVLTVGYDDLDMLVGHLVALGAPFEALEPPELRDRLRSLGKGLTRAHAGDVTPARGRAAGGATRAPAAGRRAG